MDSVTPTELDHASLGSISASTREEISLVPTFQIGKTKENEPDSEGIAFGQSNKHESESDVIPFDRRNENEPDSITIPFDRRNENEPDSITVPFDRRNENEPDSITISLGQRNENESNLSVISIERKSKNESDSNVISVGQRNEKESDSNFISFELHSLDLSIPSIPSPNVSPSRISKQSLTTKEEKEIKLTQTGQKSLADCCSKSISESTVGEITLAVPKDEPSKKSKSFRGVQYIGFSLLSIASALTVMIVWYSNSNRSESNMVGISPQKYLNESFFNSPCEHWEIVGDGYCDDVANIEDCGYDLNDCCKMEKDRTLCSNCTCHISEKETQKIKNEFMDDFCPEGEFRYIGYSTFLGDSVCQLNLNKGKSNLSIGFWYGHL